MKVVILAAGMGTRLARTLPKPLISLKDEETILDYQIRNITRYVSIQDIYVVVGYKKELLMEKYPELLYVYNNGYAQTNTGRSLLLALRKIEEDTIWLNGDIFFEDRVLEKLMGSRTSAVLVQKKECGEEEVKYTVDRKGFVREISKNVRNSPGESVGINLIKKKDIPGFVRHLEKTGPRDYFEKAMERMIRLDKVRVRPVDIGDLFCVEIDFPEDLERVRDRLRSRVY
ncbi:MAG: phosphocholine cytidylyltransferase family protein [Candidatus Omnitrophica bacterium]|nr:phosphocholine cytidylyltransferase family protein [Candidatus Omnitrophota bacterium]